MSVKRKRTALGLAALFVFASVVCVAAPAAHAAEQFQVIAVDTVGCNSGNFGMTVERSGLDGDSYTARTVVTVDGLVYMNESASISVNGESGWNIFDNFSYGPVPNQGAYPIPSDQEMRLDFTVERPVGTVLSAWTLVVDGCNTGAILYNGPTDTVAPLPAVNVTAVAQPLQATVSWDGPAGGSSQILGYEVLNAQDEVVASTSPAVTSVAVIGLGAGTLQTFRVVTNGPGGGTTSMESDQVTIQAAQQTFSDVPPGAPFYAEINWAIVEGITTGYGDGTFKGPQPVARQATAAFLYRLAGEPAYIPPLIPTFSDVPLDSPFYLQVEWLNATGITTGFPDGTFRPAAGTPRQAMAAFLYRFAGEPEFTPPVTPSFPDVSLENSFYLEVEWLVTTGITTGFGDGLFQPLSEVTRQAIVTFLYRYTTQIVPTAPPILL